MPTQGNVRISYFRPAFVAATSSDIGLRYNPAMYVPAKTYPSRTASVLMLVTGRSSFAKVHILPPPVAPDGESSSSAGIRDKSRRTSRSNQGSFLHCNRS